MKSIKSVLETEAIFSQDKMHKYIKLTQLVITILSEIITWMKESERKEVSYE